MGLWHEYQEEYLCDASCSITSTGKLSKMMKQTTHARHKRSIKPNCCHCSKKQKTTLLLCNRKYAHNDQRERVIVLDAESDAHMVQQITNISGGGNCQTCYSGAVVFRGN